jgi:hypothetical protein
VTLPPLGAGSPRPRAQPHSRVAAQTPAAVRLAASDLSDNGVMSFQSHWDTHLISSI